MLDSVNSISILHRRPFCFSFYLHFLDLHHLDIFITRLIVSTTYTPPDIEFK